jgi:hypothetical protein
MVWRVKELEKNTLRESEKECMEEKNPCIQILVSCSDPTLPAGERKE